MGAQLLGGIGLFLLGVFLVSDGLKAAAGDRLRRVLVRFTGRPVTAFVSGAGITVLVQSSSATTLATLGFVSAGILTFSQALGVVMGASLGTTTTGWLVSLAGLQSGFSKLAFPLVGLGALVRIVCKGRNAGAALAVAGFGLMFVGLDILQTGMNALSELVSFDTLPRGTFLSRIGLVGIGIALTLITQSSAAAVAATLAAFHTSLIDLEQGASLIIGASVGTTSTSGLAAIGATTPVKRTALAHVLFSAIAGMLALMLVPAFVWSVGEAERILNIRADAVVLAAFHSGFTLLAALLVLPGVRSFARVVERLVPEHGPALTKHLDASLREVPEIAIEAVRRTLMAVAAEALNQLRQGLQNPAPPKPNGMDAVLAALNETRRFLGTISFPASRPGDLNARVSVIQALDHVGQLAVVVKKLLEPSREHDHPQLQEPKRTVLKIIDKTLPMLEGQAVPLAGEKLEPLALGLAERRRGEHAALFEASAHGKVAPAQALRLLDRLRWLDAVGYHTWRALHYLSADPNGTEDRTTPEFGEEALKTVSPETV